MKICPQCNGSFADDYVFCMNDGTTLRDESGEQETLVGQRFSIPATTALSPDMLIECSSCGLANRANSKFCKKCGGPIGVSSSQNELKLGGDSVFGVSPQFVHPPTTSDTTASGQSLPPMDQTIAFQPQIFTPPGQSAAVESRGSGGPSRNALIAILSVLIVAGVVIIYGLQSDGIVPANNSQPNTNRVIATAANQIQNAANTMANVPATSSYQSNNIGRTGRLTRNLLIRSGSNLHAESLGAHYANARVRILDEESYSTNDGWATWWRVQVIENGCDQRGIQGCGNDLNEVPGQAAMEGWMNSKYISLE